MSNLHSSKQVASSSANSKVFVESTISCIVAITIIALILSVFSMYSILIIVFGILPGIIALIIDQEAERYISRIILTYNCLGISPYIIKILRNTSSNSIVVDLLIDPCTWLVIFGSAALGWIVYWLFPQTALTLNNVKVSARIKQLENEVADLVKEWGTEIRPVGTNLPF